VETTAPRDFLDGTSAATTTLSTLDPDVAPLAEAMLQDARRAGFRIHVIATYRSPLREAYLMALGSGRTHTLTSNHSYGRALDIVVGDGRLVHARNATGVDRVSRVGHSLSHAGGRIVSHPGRSRSLVGLGARRVPRRAPRVSHDRRSYSAWARVSGSRQQGVVLRAPRRRRIICKCCQRSRRHP
jgi:hypothetical protein